VPWRKDIKSLTVSPLSIMPAGFEVIPPDDLKVLLEHLATKRRTDSIPADHATSVSYELVMEFWFSRSADARKLTSL